MEEWRYHPNYGTKYMFSNLGRVKRMPYVKNRVFKNASFPIPKLYGEKILVGSKLSQKGYCRVNLEGRAKFVHVLICEAFHGFAIGDKNQVNHENGIKTDNREKNLGWVTNQENRNHAVANNLHPNRSNGFCIITDSDIPAILERRRVGETYKSISKDYGVHPDTIGSIIRKNNL